MARPATHSHSQVQTKETTTSQQTTYRVTKFDQVRSVLRDLEGSAKNFKSSNAAAELRIPLRHSSQPLQDSVSAPKRYFSDKLEQSLLTSIFCLMQRWEERIHHSFAGRSHFLGIKFKVAQNFYLIFLSIDGRLDHNSKHSPQLKYIEYTSDS